MITSTTNKLCEVCESPDVHCSVLIDEQEGIEATYCLEHMDGAIELVSYMEAYEAEGELDDFDPR